jgi:ubiquinone/menaquinone biosynthesis C-methylase UbiE
VDVYEEMAENYDLIYNDEWDVEFYLREAKNARGSVLEAACGTGRILLKLISEGIDATGLDLSESMLKVLKSKAEKMGLKPDVHHANMIDFKLDKKFNLIIAPYRSFLHLDDDERKKTLKNFMNHLNPGGRLIIHTYNLSEEEEEMIGGYHKFDHEEFNKDGKKYVLDWYLHHEPHSNQGNYRINLKFEDGREVVYEMTTFFISTKEMKALLEKAGFKNIRQYCGFEYRPFDESCNEVLWFAER